MAAGVDWIGLNFVPSSRRFVDEQQAILLSRKVGGRIPLVGVFQDQELGEIEAILRKVPLDAIQLHGRESLEFCSRLPRPVWKVFHVGRGWDPVQVRRQGNVSTILFDTAKASGPSGGSGLPFDWSLLPANPPHPWFLAGGLGLGNVATALNLYRPDGLDLNSGVESAPGIKDPAKLDAIMDIVSVWRTQAVVVGLPGRPGDGVLVGGEMWPCWVASADRESPEVETRGLLDLLEIHGRLVLDLRQRDSEFRSLSKQLMEWQMAARESGARLRFRLPESAIESMVRDSLGGLLEIVD